MYHVETEQYENVTNCTNSPKNLVTLLSAVKAKEICHRITALCLTMRDTDGSTDEEDKEAARESLRMLVDDPKLCMRLGI